MGIETLNGVDKIGGEAVVNMDLLREKYPEKFNESGAMDWQWFEEEIRPNAFIYAHHGKNSLWFTMQKGPIKEVGKNGVQWTTLIEAGLHILKGLNSRFPCRENTLTITKLEEALMWQERRTKDRESRGVEGYDKA
jgi:hypothetical protein